jgi:hypothetical protein
MANDAAIDQALTALREERARIDQAIAALEAVSGRAPGSTAATGPMGASSIDGRGDIITHPGEFHSHSLTEAADKILRRAGRPVKTNELVAALQRAEFETKSKAFGQSLYTGLARHKGFVKVRPNTWGLSEWFPKAAPKTDEGDGRKRRKKTRRSVSPKLVTKKAEKAENEQELKLKTG